MAANKIGQNSSPPAATQGLRIQEGDSVRLPNQILKDALGKPLGIVHLGPVEVRSKWLHDYRGAIEQFHGHAAR